MIKVNRTYVEIFIEGVSLEKLCYVYKSEKCERIISGILKDVLSKSKSKKQRLTRKTLKMTTIHSKKTRPLIDGIDLFGLILNYRIALENVELLKRVKKMRQYRKIIRARRKN